jgi:hypothetical protein
MEFRNRRGTQKPAALINPNQEHPFMQGHLLSCLFDGSGTFPLWRRPSDASGVGWANQGGALFGGPALLVGGATKPRASTIVDPFNAVGCAYVGNRDGLALHLMTAFNYVNLGESSFLPTTGVTILCVRRLLDNSGFNAGLLFHVGANNAQVIEAYTPSTASGNTFWDYGGVAGANRISGNTGLAVSTVSDRLAFTAGPLGSAVWQNGIKVLSQTTAITRSASTADLTLNGTGAADGAVAAQFNFFMIVDHQWSDDLCRWWSAEPYDHLYAKSIARSVPPVLPGLTVPNATITKQHAWRASAQDAMLGWVELRHKDAAGVDQTFFWSEVPIADATNYKEPRLLSLGYMNRARSTDKTGQLEGSTFSFEVADTDNAIRGFFGNVNQRNLVNVEVCVKACRVEDYLRGNVPLVLFRGRVKNYKATAQHRFRFDCQDWLSGLIDQNIQLPTIGAAFPQAPAATRDRYGQVWYGRVSDEASATVSPTPAAESYSEATAGVPSTTWPTGEAVAGVMHGATEPAGLSASEFGAGDLLPGNIVYPFWTRFVGGVESEPQDFNVAANPVTISGSGVGLKLTGTPDGADKYRFYIGVDYFGIRAGQFIETTDPATGVVFTRVPGAGTIDITLLGIDITPGATPYGWYAFYEWTVTVEMADGESVIGNIWRAPGTGTRRGLTLVWTPVASAIQYHVLRRPINGDWDHRFTVATSHTNGGGDVYFEDSLLDDDVTVELIDGALTPQGVVPCVHVGQQLDINDLFIETVADGTVVKVDPGHYGADIAAPGKTNFSLFFPAVFVDGQDLTRWTLVYALGPIGFDLAQGTTVMRANIDGVEDIGDGTGTLLTDYSDQIGHLLDNYILPTTPYAGNVWATSVPAWGDGTLKRHLASFAAAKTEATANGIGTGGWGITTADRVPEVLARAMVTSDGFYGPSREGAIIYGIEDPFSGTPNPVESYDETNDIEDRSLEWEDTVSRNWFYNQERFACIPTYSYDGEVTYRLEGVSDDTDSQTAYGLLPAAVFIGFIGARSEAAGADLSHRRIVRSRQPPRPATFKTGLPAALREVGDIIAITTTEGADVTGWAAKLMMIQNISMDWATGKTALTVRELREDT